MGRLLFLVLVIAVLAFIAWWISREWSGDAERVEEAKHEVRGYVDRLGRELTTLAAQDDAALGLLAEAADRLNTARNQLASATTLGQVRAARETARTGLYFLGRAHETTGCDPGPPTPN
ncbi:hypothetical protein DFR70_11161 [Nocardia tenerifensis]|uniref:Uncharacterized protein n=1 Tax=Nocardia tenerifensis TaxID=228006 RepID=A0A318JT13_9NOCA|nr:hypothetical protein [Nocardia tenerifensis]PXX59679.1 hypothetical protein DFR70_11161 [Nocardia tenerifensis]